MSDLNWALLMGAIAIVQSFRAEYHARAAIRAEAASRDEYNTGYREGAEAEGDKADEGQGAWQIEALQWRKFVEDFLRKTNDMEAEDHD